MRSVKRRIHRLLGTAIDKNVFRCFWRMLALYGIHGIEVAMPREYVDVFIVQIERKRGLFLEAITEAMHDNGCTIAPPPNYDDVCGNKATRLTRMISYLGKEPVPIPRTLTDRACLFNTTGKITWSITFVYESGEETVLHDVDIIAKPYARVVKVIEAAAQLSNYKHKDEFSLECICIDDKDYTDKRRLMMCDINIRQDAYATFTRIHMAPPVPGSSPVIYDA